MVEDLLKNELGLPQDKIFVEPTLRSRSILMQNINPHTFIQNLTNPYQKRMVLQITFTMRIKMVYF